MKLHGLFFIISSLLLSQAQAQSYWQADPAPPRFCVQNFNAYGPIYAKDIAERTSRMTAELQAIPKCDVVHLQEVWNESQINQVENDLKRQYQISSPNRDSRIGVMSLFMDGFEDPQTHTFKVNNEGGVLDTVRETFNVRKAFHVVRAGFFGIEEKFYFLNTHLHPMSQAVRVAQILDLLKWRLEHQDLKVIISGDFNSDPGSLEHKLMKLILAMSDSVEGRVGSYPRGLCTYCVGNPRSWMFTSHVWDYIYYSNIGKATTALEVLDSSINMRGTPRRPLSDHYGVRTRFNVITDAKGPAADVILKRRKDAIQVLAQAVQVLEKQKDQTDLLAYAQYSKELQRQLIELRGDYNTYFESFR